MPGVDGLPCGCWKHPGAQAILLDFYLNCVYHPDDPLPGDFHEMLMVFLAKGDHHADATAASARKPSSTRPLSMGWTDCKLIAAAIVSPLTH
eukprot:6127174-Pyramimonas_sp.AAC.1